MTLTDWIIVIMAHAGLTWWMLSHWTKKAKSMLLDTIKDPSTLDAIRDGLMSRLPAPFAALMRKD